MVKMHHDVCEQTAAYQRNLDDRRFESNPPIKRRQVLELVWESHQPVKAYDLLEMLAADPKRTERKRVAPPTVYRALDFLRDAGLVHKLESLNAYIGCGQPSVRHRAQFLICTACGAVAEMGDANLSAMIDANAARLGFEVGDEKVEVSGKCKACVQANA